MSERNPPQHHYKSEASARRYEPGLNCLIEGRPSVLFRSRSTAKPGSLASAVRGAIWWFGQHPAAHPKLAVLNGAVRTKIRPEGVEVHWWNHAESKFSDFADYCVPASHNT